MRKREFDSTSRARLRWEPQRLCYLAVARMRRYQTKLNPALCTLQVYSQQGEAVQVRRVRQRFLPKPYPSRAQNPSHGRISSQMPGLRSKLQPTQQPENPPPHSHGSQTLRVYLVRQGVSQKLRPEEARVDARGRRRASRSVGGGSQGRRQPGRGLPGCRLVVVRVHDQLLLASFRDERFLSLSELVRTAATASSASFLVHPSTETSSPDQKRPASGRKAVLHGNQQRNWRTLRHAESSWCAPTPTAIDSDLVQTKNRIPRTVEGAAGVAGTREGTRTRDGTE